MTAPPPDTWEELRRSLESLQHAVGRSEAVNVNAVSLREEAKRLVQKYFRFARPDLEAIGFGAQDLETVDGEMQALLGLSNGRNAKRSYVSTLRRLRTLLGHVELDRELRLGQIPTTGTGVATSGIETRILETLKGLVPSAALSYEQAVRDLASGDRVSFRGTANELREALRETLDHLAPDGDVKKVEGFKLEKNQTKPTQKQKVRHILRSRGLGDTARKAPEASVSLVDELTASVTRASYERGSLSAHITSNEREVRQMKMYLDSVLAELLEIHGSG